ncbi:amidohydrolase [Halomonas sp. M20]|uniref:amidohydrolase n=1 Tax=Halomonas sp. M20 TaxID=2763264 RepID=UPI001D0A86B0|nr:amidohydrolase [Halomonas sp. M20]
MLRKTLLSLSIATISLSTQAQTTVIDNANGYGFDTNRQLVPFSTLIIEDGKVVARGDKQLAADYPEAENAIDAEGKTLLPGLIDAHGHFMALGYSLLEVDLRDLESARQGAKKVANFASQNPNLEWIRGGGWNQVLWEGQEFPTAETLDAMITERPVVLSRVDKHAIWVNSKAMELAGIDADTQAPEGGEILRDDEGNPIGVFIDNAEQLITDKIPDRSQQEMTQAFDTAVAHLQEVGITSVHDAGASAAELALFRSRDEAGQLGVRLYPMIASSDPQFEALLEKGPQDDPEDWLDIRSVKIFADGALGSRGAALLKQYSDRPDSKGLMLQDKKSLQSLVDVSSRHGFQANMHAIGDRANRIALNIYEENLKNDSDARKLRHRIEHAQVVNVNDIPRFSALGVIPSMQPTHATSDKNMAGDRLGQQRLAGAYAWRFFLDNGSRVAAGSDFPVEPANPFYGLHAAVTREDRDDQPQGGWLPGQKLTATEALRAFTLDAAYAAHQEKSLGGLMPGQWADFILVDTDIIRTDPENIWQTQVAETWIAGEQMYSAAKAD